MNQLTYIPGTVGADAIGLDGGGSFVGIASNLRSRAWAYKLGYRDIETANRPAREVSLDFETDYATADAFRRAADADVLARTPGMFLAQGEWRQRGYITSAEPSYIHYGRLGVKLGCILLEGAWWRVRSQSFAAENTVIEDRYESATGEQVVTVGADSAPLHSLSIEGKSVQDGTPTPSRPVPVQTVKGINLLTPRPSPATVVNGITYTAHDDGSISISGTATADADYQISDSSNNLIYVPAGQYTVYVNGFTSGVYFIIAGGGQNGFPYKVLTETAPSATNWVTDGTKPFTYIILRVASGATVNTTIYPQLNAGATAQPYVPYGALGLAVTANGETTVTPIDLQGNVLASLPDGTKDVLTVDPTGHVTLTKNAGAVDLGTLTWSLRNGVGMQTGGLSSLIKNPSGNDYLPNVYADVAAQMRWTQLVNGGTSSGGVGVSGGYVCISTAETDAAAFKTATTGEYLYYPLATSQTVDLGTIEMPDVYDGAVVDVIAEVTPTITAEWKLANVVYLDYPHDYQYDYMKSSNNTEITTSVLTPSDVRITIFGAVSNPYIIVGDNRYQVNVTVPAGGYLEIDGREKTITLTLADGTQQNVFGAGVRGSGMGGGEYIFEPIKGGAQQVQWSGAFGFDLAWYEDEGEPPWSR